jgi:hypothetical protein
VSVRDNARALIRERVEDCDLSFFRHSLSQ